MPSRTVLLGPDGPFVYLVSPEKKALIRHVAVDIEWEGNTVISKGLVPGDQIVLEGHVRLKDGVAVRIAESRTDRNPDNAK